MAVFSEEARKIEDSPVSTNGQALAEAIRIYPGYMHLLLEDGLQNAWIYEMLNPHVDELVVAGIRQNRGLKSPPSAQDDGRPR